LSDEILEKMRVTKLDFPTASNETLLKYDAFLFGIPTRFGNMPAQLKVRCSPLFVHIFTKEQAFWDATGGLWNAGKLDAKYAGVFVSTGATGGGQESTVISFLSTLAHHGIIYVPLGYSSGFDELNNLNLREVHGGRSNDPSSSEQ
jgi:NAD(P)H dehydrogenase (quinone)